MSAADDIQFMITEDMKRRLRAMGYTSEQIDKMTPPEARAILTPNGAANKTEIRGDTDAALEFIARFRPAGTICLTAIIPDGPTETRTFDVTNTSGLREWIDARQGQKNIYFNPNVVRGYLTKKSKKADMAEAAAVWVDADPDKEAEKQPGGFERERQRIAGIPNALMLSEDPCDCRLRSGSTAGAGISFSGYSTSRSHSTPATSASSRSWASGSRSVSAAMRSRTWTASCGFRGPLIYRARQNERSGASRRSPS